MAGIPVNKTKRIDQINICKSIFERKKNGEKVKQQKKSTTTTTTPMDMTFLMKGVNLVNDPRKKRIKFQRIPSEVIHLLPIFFFFLVISHIPINFTIDWEIFYIGRIYLLLLLLLCRPTLRSHPMICNLKPHNNKSI